jgi:hypothetical protein
MTNISEYVNIEAILEESGSYASVTSGVSMRPLFKTHRDMVILEKPQGILKKYDVALYKVGERYVLHRVIRVNEADELYIIRGDNTFRLERVPYSSVIGVLTAFNRNGKYHTVNEKGYRFYSVVWTAVYPLRWLLHQPRRIASFIKRKLKK